MHEHTPIGAGIAGGDPADEAITAVPEALNMCRRLVDEGQAWFLLSQQYPASEQYEWELEKSMQLAKVALAVAQDLWGDTHEGTVSS